MSVYKHQPFGVKPVRNISTTIKPKSLLDVEKTEMDILELKTKIQDLQNKLNVIDTTLNNFTKRITKIETYMNSYSSDEYSDDELSVTPIIEFEE
jgi:hypothetical protein